MSRDVVSTTASTADVPLRLLSGDAARDAAAVIRSILDRSKPASLSDRFFESDHGATWNELVSGGWLSLGMTEESGGVGFHPIDLASVAEAWGRYLVPLPFIPTLLIHRWSARGSGSVDGSMLTYSLPQASKKKAESCLSPYLPVKGVRQVTNLAQLGGRKLGPPHMEAAVSKLNTGVNERGKKVADHAPSLPFAFTNSPTQDLPAGAKQEIAFLCAAELIGCGSVVLDTTVEYARSRQQFGHAIVEHQAIQHRFANMHRDVEIARTAVTWAANEPERALDAVRIVWDKIKAVTENSFQIHGGYGFTWEAGIHFYSRHVWAMGRLLTACGVRLWPS